MADPVSPRAWRWFRDNFSDFGSKMNTSGMFSFQGSGTNNRGDAAKSCRTLVTFPNLFAKGSIKELTFPEKDFMFAI